MTIEPALEPQAAGKYAHLEPLPDPPRKHDMRRRLTASAFDNILQPHFSHRTDMLICGEGYLRNDPTNDAEVEIRRLRERLRCLQAE